MTAITQSELTTVLQRPHRTKLYLSFYQPKTIFTARLNNTGSAQGDRVIYYDDYSGTYTDINYGMSMYVGSEAGSQDKGRIRIRSATTGSVINVAENSHILWADNDYLTVVDFYEINGMYPRYIQDPADDTLVIFYKDYDITYTNQNTIYGSFVNMGGNYAGFVEDSVFYTASGTTHVVDGVTLTYYWEIETDSGTTGTNLHTPGYIKYDTPGHYTTSLIVSGSNGSSDVAYRHISIYDRIGEGDNVPIVEWELDKLQASRDSGGWSATVKILEVVNPDVVRDGSIVTIFSDEDYGNTYQEIGGSQINRNSIVFSGYVIDGSVKFDYKSNSVSFDVGSPVDIMKMCDSYSISLEDIDDPVTRHASDPDYYTSPWALAHQLTTKKAIYHYLRWHSTVLNCVDFTFSATDQKIQFFDSDRTSLYDAVNSLMRNALLGNIASDMQGKLWAETYPYIEDKNQNLFVVDNSSWVNEPTIEESLTGKVSFIEVGGTAYEWYAPSTGTTTPYLSAVPGVPPSYRGAVERQQGLALSSQAQLNTVAGKLFSYKNRRYPTISMNMAGTYRFMDIAPFEKFLVTIPADKSPYNKAISEYAFVDKVSWKHDPVKETFIPNVTFSQIPSNPVSGVTQSIPPIAPDDGYKITPVPIPPIPPIPPIVFGGGEGLSRILQPGVFFTSTDPNHSPEVDNIYPGENLYFNVSCVNRQTIIFSSAGNYTITPFIQNDVYDVVTLYYAYIHYRGIFADYGNFYEFDGIDVYSGSDTFDFSSVAGNGECVLTGLSLVVSIQAGDMLWLEFFTENEGLATNYKIHFHGWIIE